MSGPSRPTTPIDVRMKRSKAAQTARDQQPVVGPPKRRSVTPIPNPSSPPLRRRHLPDDEEAEASTPTKKIRHDDSLRPLTPLSVDASPFLRPETPPSPMRPSPFLRPSTPPSPMRPSPFLRPATPPTPLQIRAITRMDESVMEVMLTYVDNQINIL